MARRVESAGISVEQTFDTNNRRVESVGVMVEQRAIDMRRMESIGIWWRRYQDNASTQLAFPAKKHSGLPPFWVERLMKMISISSCSLDFSCTDAGH